MEPKAGLIYLNNIHPDHAVALSMFPRQGHGPQIHLISISELTTAAYNNFFAGLGGAPVRMVIGFLEVKDQVFQLGP